MSHFTWQSIVDLSNTRFTHRDFKAFLGCQAYRYQDGTTWKGAGI
jgi:hypothetical protein